MKNKFLSALSLILIILSIGTVAASAETLTSGYLDYIVNEDNTVTITKRNVNNLDVTSIVIPDTIDGKRVVAVKDGAFNYASDRNITKLTIDGEVSLGDKSFYSCPLTELTFGPNGKLTNIGDYAFSDSVFTTLDIKNTPGMNIGQQAFSSVKSLKSISFSDSLGDIGYRVFFYCEGLEAIDLSKGVSSIGEDAFYMCTSLASVKLPETGTVNIGNDAFNSDSKLTEITIPGGSIGNSAFRYCALTKLVLNGTSSIGESAFNGNPLLSDFTMGKDAVITSIGQDAFYGTAIKSVTLPAGITSIGFRAFYGCKSLESVKIYGSDVTIDGEAFSGCNKLTTVELPTNLTSIEDCTFCSCNISQITIPSSVTSIGYAAFAGCPLTSIILPEGLTTIGNGAFESTKLTSLAIPASTTNLGLSTDYMYSSFIQGCTSLTTLTVDDANPNFKAVDNVLYSKDGTVLLAYAPGRTNESYTVPDEVKQIFWYVFGETANLKKLNIHKDITQEYLSFIFCSPLYNASGYELHNDSLEEITVAAENTAYKVVDGILFTADGTELILFPSKKALDSYTVPSGVEYIDPGAFFRTNVKSITLPDSVKTICTLAFSGSSVLESISVPSTMTQVSADIFVNCTAIKALDFRGYQHELGDFYNCLNHDSIKAIENAEITYIGSDEDGDGESGIVNQPGFNGNINGTWVLAQSGVYTSSPAPGISAGTLFITYFGGVDFTKGDIIILALYKNGGLSNIYVCDSDTPKDGFIDTTNPEPAWFLPGLETDYTEAKVMIWNKDLAPLMNAAKPYSFGVQP